MEVESIVVRRARGVGEHSQIEEDGLLHTVNTLVGGFAEEESLFEEEAGHFLFEAKLCDLEECAMT